MPIYEYHCHGCDKDMEIIQQGQGVRRKCPECGGKLEKLVSRTSFQLKGGGWYDQGYSSSGSGKPSGSKNSSSSKKKSKSSSKSND